LSEKKEAGQERYCGNCGAVIRPGNEFCTSCGMRLPQEPEGSSQTRPRASPQEQPASIVDTLQVAFQKAVGWLKGISLASRVDDFRVTLSKVIRWFKNLPVISKVVLTGLVVLVLLVLLSPLVLLIAVLAFGVSIIGLIVRVVQRRSVRGWGIVAAVSLVLIFVFAGISYALYGVGSSETTGSDPVKAREPQDPPGDIVASKTSMGDAVFNINLDDGYDYHFKGTLHTNGHVELVNWMAASMRRRETGVGELIMGPVFAKEDPSSMTELGETEIRARSNVPETNASPGWPPTPPHIQAPGDVHGRGWYVLLL
jgi:hypothetical protein